jgi:propane monooxygenase small subunit
MSRDERSFGYFEPAGRRATLYEDVTVDTQPSVHRHMERGWLVSFEDGRGTWDESSTALRSTDWYAFRDPGQLWERPFYQAGSASEANIEGAVRSATREHLFEDFRAEWVDFLRANLQVPAFAEHGLWLATASVGRDCLSDSITHCVVLEAAHKQRLAQSIVLYAMDLEGHFGELPPAAAKQRWMEHPAWQPARRFVEHLHSTTDWAEVIVAANLCYEPLAGTLIRRELGMRTATLNGDQVTPVVARAGQLEWNWTADWTAEFMKLVLADERHGSHNRGVVAGWIGSWMAQAKEATEALSRAVEQAGVGFDAADSRVRVDRDAAAFYKQAGVADLVGGPR